MSRPSADQSVFYAIADPTRREILTRLRDEEQAAGDLAPPGVSQSAVSQHLAILSRAGLVTARREGRRRYYSLRPMPLYEVVDWVRYFDRFWDRKLANLGSYLARKRK